MSNFPNMVHLNLPKPRLKTVSSNVENELLREQLLETHDNLKRLCEYLDCVDRYVYALEQFKADNPRSQSNSDLALLNNVISGSILSYIS